MVGEKWRMTLITPLMTMIFDLDILPPELANAINTADIAQS